MTARARLDQWECRYYVDEKPTSVGGRGDKSCELDELVLGNDKVPVLHLERMDDRDWWMQVGDAWIWISVSRKGVTVNIRRGEYGPVNGLTDGPGHARLESDRGRS